MLKSKMMLVVGLVFSLILFSATVLAQDYNEAPILAEKVNNGELPPVSERLPEEPMVVEVENEIGQYGGTWNRLWLGLSDTPGPDRLTRERLVYWDREGKGVGPNVAKDWDITKGGRKFTFYLRKGMKWSDGEPYTAEDIMFWFEDMMLNEEITPAFPSWLIVDGERVKVEMEDKYTISFEFAAPYGIFLNYLAGPQGHAVASYPKHFLKQYHPKYTDEEELKQLVEEEGYDFWYQLFLFKANDMYAYADRPRISAWYITRPGNKPQMVMSRNPYFWKVDPEGNQLPYIDEIVHDLVEDIEVLNIRAINGDVDMQFRHLLNNKLPMFINNQQKSNYKVLRYKDAFETNLAIGINLNNQDPVLREIVQDDRFRKALSHAINRDELNQIAYLGMCEKPKQVVPLEDSVYYTETAAEYEKTYIEYNPEKANEYLDEMGLTEYDGKYRLRPDGEVLTLTYEFTNVFGPWQQAAELIADYWGDVGVKVNVKMEERTLFYERKEALKHDVGVWTGAAGMHPVLGPRWYLPYSTESIQAIGYAQWYQTGGKQGVEPEGDLRKVIELYDELKAATTTEEQVELFDEILKLNKEHLWVIGTLSSPPLIGLVKNNFHNVPEMSVYSWVMNSPTNFMPEQFYISQ